MLLTLNVPQSNGSPAHYVIQLVAGSWCQTLHLMRSPRVGVQIITVQRKGEEFGLEGGENTGREIVSNQTICMAIKWMQAKHLTNCQVYLHMLL